MEGEIVTHDGLKRLDLTVTQPASGYRFSLDALLLADFVTGRDDTSFIDLGTGSGIIPLIICRRFPRSTAVAVENNPGMVEIAKGNAAQNGLSDRCEIIHADVTSLKSLYPVSTFDLVVSNPPYRTVASGRVSPRTGRDTARHESTARLTDFLSAAKYLVKPSGRICFVYHPDRLAEFVHRATEQNLSLLRLRMVHGVPHGNARIFLAELAKDSRAGTLVMPPLVIRGEDGEYTREARIIFGEDA